MRRRLWHAWCTTLEFLEATGRTINTDILGPETREEHRRTRQKQEARRARW